MISMAETANTTPHPVIVKKYANRRLYNTESSSYITLENLAEMVRKDRDFVVYDAKSGEDITRGVLTQIIVEEEGKGNAMLPTNFLRQLIGFSAATCKAPCPATSNRRCPASPAAGKPARHRAKNPQPLPAARHRGHEPQEHGNDGPGHDPVHPLPP